MRCRLEHDLDATDVISNTAMQGWVEPDLYKYNCPGERQLQVEYNMTPQDYSLAGLWSAAPAFFFFSFAFSFLGVCLGIGIFKCASLLDSGLRTVMTES